MLIHLGAGCVEGSIKRDLVEIRYGVDLFGT